MDHRQIFRNTALDVVLCLWIKARGLGRVGPDPQAELQVPASYTLPFQILRQLTRSLIVFDNALLYSALLSDNGLLWMTGKYLEIQHSMLCCVNVESQCTV